MPDPIDELLANLAEQDAAAAEALQSMLGPEAGELTLAAPSVFSGLCDPSWKKISASLRKDPGAVPCLYLKLPNGVLREVIRGISFSRVEARQNAEGAGTTPDFTQLDELIVFLEAEAESSRAQSIFLRIPVEDAEKDIQALKAVQGLSTNEVTKDFTKALEGGLRNDPSRDWIARCGGPACNVSLEQPCDCGSSCGQPSPQMGAEILGLPE